MFNSKTINARSRAKHVEKLRKQKEWLIQLYEQKRITRKKLFTQLEKIDQHIAKLLEDQPANVIEPEDDDDDKDDDSPPGGRSC